MNRRKWLVITGATVAVVGSLLSARFRSWVNLFIPGVLVNDRVVFVCCDDQGNFSPGIYLHGAAGGGRAALGMVREAAPYMRDLDVGDAAAGLCGFTFKSVGDDAASAGVLSLYDAPKPKADGSVAWGEYVGRDTNVILVNVVTGLASCPFGDAVGQEIRGLKFGKGG
jgi:hypothetical protein